MASISNLGVAIFIIIGLSLVLLLALSLFSRNQSPRREGMGRELDRLFSDISRALRTLSSPSRAGGLFYREKQEEVGRLLAELQSRLRLLDDSLRQNYEARAGRILADAARAGITVPPLENPLITGHSPR